MSLLFLLHRKETGNAAGADSVSHFKLRKQYLRENKVDEFKEANFMSHRRRTKEGWPAITSGNPARRVVLKKAWTRQLAWLGFILLIWTLVGIFFASQIYFFFIRTAHAISFNRAIVWQLIAVYLMACITPLVLWLARRYRIERHNWLRRLLVHLLAGTLISAFTSAGHVLIDNWFVYGIAQVEVDKLLRSAFVNLDKEIIVYWLIVLMSHAFNYYQKYRESELSKSQLAAQLAEAQLRALKMQLHPHFLFNTLHSISALLGKDTETAREMIACLGDFLRMTLDNSGAQEVTLRQELEFLKCYLDIEMIRFSDRLSVRIDVDPQTLNYQVPNLILQPIVENAILHGIAPRSAPGQIEVEARRHDRMLRLSVRDNGGGLQKGTHAGGQSKGGVGLTNTRERLSQLYGSEHYFELHNDPQGGLVVTMDIPCYTDE
ncbi:MAG: two-component system, LytTR family, sensor kinase [Blastocatellia bacterium]|jgi:signal transduction histidine kinase|nr:two-component system, LytTR family, sensor kinase [Blastocatellia bacterium]